MFHCPLSTRCLPTALALCLLVACGSPQVSEPPQAAERPVIAPPASPDLDGEAEPSSPGVLEVSALVSGDWLEAHLERPELLVIHIGGEEDGSASTGLIPGQVRLSFEDIVVRDRHGIGFVLPELAALREAFASAGVSDDRVVVLTGDREGLFAARGLFSLHVLGLGDRVGLLDGGLEQWVEDGRPTADAPAEPVRGSITAEPRMDLVVDAQFVRDHLEHPGLQLLDARPPMEYRGAVAGDDVLIPGHIPGAANVFWMDTLRAEDRPLMRSREALEEMFIEKEIDPADELVVYCRLGLMASFAFFVAEWLEREVRVYDESYVDWTRQDDYPVVRIVPAASE